MTVRPFALGLFATLLLGTTAAAAEVRGIITRFDPARKELVLEGRGLGVRGLVLPFTLGPETQVQFGRQPGQVADLAVGRSVRVFYEPRPGQRLALLISVNGS